VIEALLISVRVNSISLWGPGKEKAEGRSKQRQSSEKAERKQRESREKAERKQRESREIAERKQCVVPGAAAHSASSVCRPPSPTGTVVIDPCLTP
jgi:hypothetical protein